MKTEYTFFKNSNTGELIFRQRFLETNITNIPDYFYDKNRKSIDRQDLNGFVEISERKFDRYSKRTNQAER
jgi:hypothetical protein